MNSLIALFTGHRVAANLLMMLMILAGIWGVKTLNTQFFPTFELDVITIQVTWSGAAAEDVERSVILPIEEELKSLSDIDTLYATANQGMASLRLELKEDADLDYLLDEVKQKIDSIRSDLPSDAEEPLVQKVIRYESIASLLLTARNGSLEELRPLAYQYERELLDLGISKIDYEGLPDQEISIQIPAAQLHELGMTMGQIADTVRLRSLDLPAGTAAKGDGSRQIRSLSQQRDVEGFRQLPLITEQQGRLVRLGDVADIRWQAKEGQTYLTYRGQPALIMALKRTENDDTLTAAGILNDWLFKTRQTLPPGIELVPYDERWQPIRDRINLLLKNGLSGLVLVICILFLFLNARVAFWVTVGIPVSFLATLAVLYGIGGSINMISLFGLIMALGIIVDDAIVVGEDTLTHLQMGEPGLEAAVGGALRMLPPVTASSLTTIAAFLPLLLVGGVIGNILIDIPTVVICVIVASLVECFLILPGHLHHSLHRAADLHPSKTRLRLDAAFNRFRDGPFRRLVSNAISFRWITLAAALMMLIVVIGLLAGGRVKFTFFPVVERESLTANVQFVAGSPPEQVSHFLAHLEETLQQADSQLQEKLVKVSYRQHGSANFSRSSATSGNGDEFGSLIVELTPLDDRETRNAELIRRWRPLIQLPAGIEKFTIDIDQAGPPGKPIEVKLTGADIVTLKAASMEVQTLLKGYQGLSNVDDDLPFGKSQLIYQLTPAGKASGLTLSSVGRQLRAAFDGLEIQSFYQSQDEVEVRLQLPKAERDRLSALEQLPIILPDGSSTPLANVVQFDAQRGLDTLARINGQLAINVSADLDDLQTNANEVIESLRAGQLDAIGARYGVNFSFEGKNKNQRETLADMRNGLLLALALIYIILAWVFSSYSWPLAVMLAIPMGLTGAVLGHFLLGQNLTILSLFGLFGLSGIVINDSIVLITFYRKLRQQGQTVEEAIVNAACQRLRAVLLTSLTTIAGLTPILFETSMQAQFLIPMAISIVFGLAYGTVLILLVVPALLTLVEGLRARLGLKSSSATLLTEPAGPAGEIKTS
ncbi:efflux RND transporter permease subunit [Marinobacterium arenosum]|uniref:efflux RND transporter permease subunit n=1 Tax=Marinobacterium arenosum TaxID=2862496 RepID=UPI001C98CF8B|nr:efflux RND transporter permease subunit [Marinobacterium arenosum]MBY4678022.1 efflux RND transporter permease subunit [Marinobacterium arenosum]